MMTNYTHYRCWTYQYHLFSVNSSTISRLSLGIVVIAIINGDSSYYHATKVLQIMSLTPINDDNKLLVTMLLHHATTMLQKSYN